MLKSIKEIIAIPFWIMAYVTLNTTYYLTKEKDEYFFEWLERFGVYCPEEEKSERRM